MLTNRFLTLPEPFDTMVREMDQVFENGRTGAARQQAPVALWEDDERVSLEVELPGVRQEDLDVTIHDGRLIISGVRNPAGKSGKCWYNEQTYGRFERVIALSDLFDTDSINAELSGGILSVTLSKKPSARPHRISVKSGDSGQPARIDAEASEA